MPAQVQGSSRAAFCKELCTLFKIAEMQARIEDHDDEEGPLTEGEYEEGLDDDDYEEEEYDEEADLLDEDEDEGEY